MLRLTKEQLLLFTACKESVDWAVANKLIGFPYDMTDQIKGDYKNWVAWTQRKALGKLEFDADGRLIRAVAPDGAVSTYEWDANGHLLRQNEPKGRVISFTYNEHGQLSKRHITNFGWTYYSYDEEGDCVHVEHRRKGGYTVEREFDTRHRLIKANYSDGLVLKYFYDAEGRISRQTSSTGAVLDYTYKFYENKQMQSMIENGKEILWFPFFEPPEKD